MKNEIRVGFLSSTDPRDKTSWSGIHYRMLQSLEQQFLEVIQLGPVKKPIILMAILFFVDLVHRIFKKRYNRLHNILISKFFAYRFGRRLKKMKIDVIFAPAASTEIAFLKTSTPICYLSDTSFNQIHNYYNYLSDLSNFSVKESNLIEQKAINNSKIQVYSSEWASKHVIDYYKAKSSNVFTVKFGANIDSIPDKSDIIKKEFNAPIKLLFIGVDWERKGGNIAFETFKILLNSSYDVTLTVCGCIPPVVHSKMTVIPFLNKNVDKDSKELTNLLFENHLLLVPTRADCTPIVFCEANAFGLPVITTHTGGVTSIIEEDINGYALPIHASAVDYARKVQLLINNPQKFKKMSLISREKFDNELNWNVWGRKMKNILLLTMNKRHLKE